MPSRHEDTHAHTHPYETLRRRLLIEYCGEVGVIRKTDGCEWVHGGKLDPREQETCQNFIYCHEGSAGPSTSCSQVHKCARLTQSQEGGGRTSAAVFALMSVAGWNPLCSSCHAAAQTSRSYKLTQLLGGVGEGDVCLQYLSSFLCSHRFLSGSPSRFDLLLLPSPLACVLLIFPSSARS